MNQTPLLQRCTEPLKRTAKRCLKSLRAKCFALTKIFSNCMATLEQRRTSRLSISLPNVIQKRVTNAWLEHALRILWVATSCCCFRTNRHLEATMQMATRLNSPRVKSGYRSIHRKQQNINSTSAQQMWSMMTTKLLMSYLNLNIKSSALLIFMHLQEVFAHPWLISRQ